MLELNKIYNMEEVKIKEHTYGNDGKIHDAMRLKELQALPLERKIAITQARIIEWYQHYDGKVYVSFSGGKDSTVLLDLARRCFPDIEAVFIDTGLEYPEIREFVKTKENVTWLKPEMNFKKVIDTYGYPLISKEVAQCVKEARSKPNGYAAKKFDSTSDYNIKYGQRFCIERYKNLLNAPFKISDECCNVMKKKPVKKFEKENNIHPILATMTCESAKRKTAWLSHGCNAFESKRPISQPMSFWTEQDVLGYIRQYNILYASVYGEITEEQSGKLKTTLCDRTGCVFCGFGCNQNKKQNQFQRLHQTHPKLWEYCMKPKEEGGLGMQEVLDYINVKSE